MVKLKVVQLSPLASTISPVFPASSVLTLLPALGRCVIFNKAEAASATLILLLHYLLTLGHWRLKNCSWQRKERGVSDSVVPTMWRPLLSCRAGL